MLGGIDSKNLIKRSGNPKKDLQEYLQKILVREKFYKVQVNYVVLDQSNNQSQAFSSFASFQNGNQNAGIIMTININ